MHMVHFYKFSVFLFFFPCMANAAVSCTYLSSPLTINAGNIILQRDMPLNSTITSELTVDEQSTTCTSDVSTTLSVGVRTELRDSGIKINGRSIFLTNKEGVGFAIGMNNWAWNNGLHWIGDGYDPSSISTHSSGWGPTTSIETGSTIHIQLYKIGSISSGELEGGTIADLVGEDVIN